MPRMKVIDIDLETVSLTGFASNVTGAAFTLTATSCTDGLAHQVSIRNDAVTNHSGKTIDLVGTDANGDALTETITAPAGAATVESTKYFKTLTSVTPSATIGSDTFDIGWVDEVESQAVPLDFYNQTPVTYMVDVTGTVTFTVYECYNYILDGSAPVWAALGALTSKTADVLAYGYRGATACKVVVESYSTGAELQVHIGATAE
jgi:hypothetical protein